MKLTDGRFLDFYSTKMTSEISSTPIIIKEKKKSSKRVPKVNTKQARSNLEVLRKSLDDLRWKEVITLHSLSTSDSLTF